MYIYNKQVPAVVFFCLGWGLSAGVLRRPFCQSCPKAVIVYNLKIGSATSLLCFLGV